jgi:hypothetical protein
MKSISIVTLLFLSLHIKSNKLEVIVANNRENLLYVGLENPIEALIENASKHAVVLTTDNGRIEKEDGNRFSITPDHIGITKINVCKVVKRDTIVIGTREFRVRELPEPEALIGLFTGGPIKKAALITMGGVRVKLNGGDFEFLGSITEYTLIAIRDSSTVGMIKNTGAQYNDSTIEFIKKLQPKDHLVICGLIAKFPSQPRLIHPAEFIIEE